MGIQQPRTSLAGFFLWIFDGGPQNFQSPSVSDGDEVGWGGGWGDLRKNQTEAKTAHLMQNKAIFLLF